MNRRQLLLGSIGILLMMTVPVLLIYIAVQL